MSNYFRLFIFLVLACVVAPASVSAQADSGNGEEWLLLQISGSLRQDAKVDAVLQQLRSIFIYSDFDRGGVSARDYALAEQVEQANPRSDMLKRWGQRDLDNDGKVTRVELELYFGRQSRQAITGQGGVSLLPTKEQSTEILAKLTSDALAWDLDHDGTITLAEVRQAASDAWAKRPSKDSDSKRRLVPLSLDANNDKTVSLAEFETAVRRVLDTIDRNGDGKISADEMTSLQERMSAIKKAKADRVEQEKIREKAKACGLTPPGAHTRIVMIGAYKGEGLSTVSLGDDDEVVGVTDIKVESGTEPLYVILTTHEANIWRFSGSVERIERVVACAFTVGASSVPRVGVTGVAHDKVTTAGLRDCIPYFDHPETDQSTRALEAVKLTIGRSPDVIVAISGADNFRIPSGTYDDKHVMAGQMICPQTGPAVALWRKALQYNSVGIIELDPATVVATLPARRYNVLPRQAGLAQLIEQGALEIFRSSEEIVVSGSKAQKVLMPSHLLIRKKMRFPAGLHGGYSTITFVLPPGVPEPEGSPGHARVIRGKEATEMIRVRDEGNYSNTTR